MNCRKEHATSMFHIDDKGEIMNTLESWFAELSNELARRGVAESAIQEEIDIVRDHIHENGKPTTPILVI